MSVTGYTHHSKGILFPECNISPNAWTWYFYMKLAQYNECLVSIVGIDGLVLQHQGISSHSADYTPMRFPVFKG